jgi:hypothetical protein
MIKPTEPSNRMSPSRPMNHPADDKQSLSNPQQAEQQQQNRSEDSTSPLAAATSSVCPSDAEDTADAANENNEDTEAEAAEWARLRCGSLTTEELVRQQNEREARRNRQNRCADYPGFAFGSAMFGSDTTMKFNIIKNELHNIMCSQLKRVDGEVNALSARVKAFDQKLEESEQLIRGATMALAEAVAVQIEEAKNRTEADDAEESSLSAFDQHVLFLEGQLKEARLKASLSFQILEDCHHAQAALLAAPSSAAHLRASASSLLSSGSVPLSALSSAITSPSSAATLSSQSLPFNCNGAVITAPTKQSSSECSPGDCLSPPPMLMSSFATAEATDNLANNNHVVVDGETIANSHQQQKSQLMRCQDHLNANLSAA